MRRWFPVLLILLYACKGDAPNEERRLPHLHPPPSVSVPDAIRIEVEIDGRPAAPIDATRLRATPPDFADDERSAWRLDRLLPVTGDARFAVEGGAGVTVVIDPAQIDRVPALLLNRRGELLVVALDPKDPFPAFHGAGGRLGRPGDSLPHVRDVRRIAVHSTALP